MIDQAKYTEQEILKRTCDYFGVNPDDFLTPSRGGELPEHVRKFYMYALHMYGGLTDYRISCLIKRDRSTVSHTIKKMKARATVDKEYQRDIIDFEDVFES